MLLAIDIGNSQTSFGVFDGDTLRYHWRTETRAYRTADEYAALLFPLLTHAGLAHTPWEGVVLCSVVPAVEYPLERFCSDYLSVVPLKIEASLDLGFRVAVDNPAEVGADRLANAAYAVERLNLPAIVVDLGTATTFDLVGDQKTYEGGVIVPGVRLGVGALSGGTAKLPPIDLEFPPSVVGKNTVACIQSGMLYGYMDLLDGILERMKKEAGPCDVALTGGLAHLFHGRLKTPSQLLPNLTLDGALLLYRRNTR